MQKRVKTFAALWLVVFLGVMGCAGMQAPQQSFEDMTPKQKATWMMGVYNAQFDDYKLKVALPNLTNDEKAVLRAKREILTQVYPLIQAYDMTQASGGTPTVTAERQVTSMLNQLEQLIIREVAK
jgi:hypothetical protein